MGAGVAIESAQQGEISMNRRDFFSTGAVAGTALLPPSAGLAAAAAPRAKSASAKFKLGTISYNIGASWDLATLLKACKSTGYEVVELRTGHGHKVETALGPDDRKRVKAQIA